MIIRLIDIGDSKGVSIPGKLIKEYELENEIEMKPVNGGLFISKKRTGREGWEEQIKSAISAGALSDNDPLESLSNDWDNIEWTWPE